MDGEEGRGLRWQTAHAGLRRLGHRQPLELVRSHRVHAPLPRREDRSLRERVQPTGAHEGRRRRLKHVPIATALSRVGEGFFVYIEIRLDVKAMSPASITTKHFWMRCRSRRQPGSSNYPEEYSESVCRPITADAARFASVIKKCPLWFVTQRRNTRQWPPSCSCGRCSPRLEHHLGRHARIGLSLVKAIY